MGAQLQTAPGLELITPGESVGVAVLARTSTLLLQDPLASLQRQLRNTRAWVPGGWHITGYYWDVESGGIDVEDRSQGEAWREFASAGIPRDGGMADLMREAAGPSPSFSIVICEDIERSARDAFNSQKIERELRDQGIMLCATDEPFDIKGISPTTILVRRVKQGVAEWFRLHLREQTWDGLVTHALDGYHVGPAPYGYLLDRIPHPVASKAAQGRTKTRLALDPPRAPVVAQIFTWRFTDKISIRGITARLQARPALYPPHREGGWTEAHVDKILRNPKYTGHMVYGRTRGRARGRAYNAPRNEWIWSPEPTHPAIITLDTWEGAQLIGAQNATSRDDDGITVTNRDRYYQLRSRVRCRIDSRRMCGNTRTKAPTSRLPEGAAYIYYLCPHDKTNPRHAAAHPDHPTVRVREDDLITAINEFFEQRVFGPDRAAMLAAQLPATAAAKARQLEKEATRLHKQLRRLGNADASGFKELDETAADNTPATLAYRHRTRARIIEREEERISINQRLAKITAQQGRTPANDPTLLDDLPDLAALLPHAPARILAGLLDALDIQCLYSKEDHQVTIRAVLTDATPQAIARLINDAAPPAPTSQPAPDDSVADLSYGPIYTVAGNGTVGFSGDGGPAASAELSSPSGVALDASGNLVLSDYNNARIRVVAASTGTFYKQAMTAGDIYTVAGGGETGGSGVLATKVHIFADAVTVDHAGNIVIADGEQLAVVAASTGVFYGQAMKDADIYIVAGNGAAGYAGDGGPATAASFDVPTGLSVDGSGNLLVADSLDSRVRVIAATGGTFYGQAMTAGDVYTVAGDGTLGFSGDGGPAAGAELDYPVGVAADGASGLLVASVYDGRVRLVTG